MAVSAIGSQHSSWGETIVSTARDRGRLQGASYARASAPTSPMVGLTDNVQPEHSRLGWLKHRNKCNQFVGDVLTLAGFAMPTFRMRDGSKHFMHAEALLDQPKFFKRVGRDVTPGDLLVIDRPGRGENSAHVEIVTRAEVAPDGALQLSTIAALADGVSERERSSWLRSARWIPSGGIPSGGIPSGGTNKRGDEAFGYFQRGAVKAFFLRPFAHQAREQ